MELPLFVEFPKLARLSRECIITEKIDGTNAQVFITEEGAIHFGSRSRWITPADDNYGFARWGTEHKDELMKLGPGHHYGEWWGLGIQRRYGVPDKRFSLFNTDRWCLPGTTPLVRYNNKPQEVVPTECVGLVPTLYRGPFSTSTVEEICETLRKIGSFAAPGFMDAEGVVVYHVAAGMGFKKTLKNDESPKSKVLCPS